MYVGWSEAVQDFLCTSYVRTIYVLCLEGCVVALHHVLYPFELYFSILIKLLLLLAATSSRWYKCIFLFSLDKQENTISESFNIYGLNF